MAIKGYSAFPKVTALLEPHHQILLRHMQDTDWEGFTLLQRCSGSILHPQPTWLDTLIKKKLQAHPSVKSAILNVIWDNHSWFLLKKSWNCKQCFFGVFFFANFLGKIPLIYSMNEFFYNTNFNQEIFIFKENPPSLSMHLMQFFPTDKTIRLFSLKNFGSTL